METKKLIVLSSPSGGGKTTIAKAIMGEFPGLRFSISATTRAIRENEIDGVDYFFMSREDFLNKIKIDEFIEYEEIFGNYYGTLKSQLQKAIDENKPLMFDIDVKGAISIRKVFPEESLLIFITPPSVEELRNRLGSRKTESHEQLMLRLNRVEMEMSYARDFDFIVINDDLNKAIGEVSDIITRYLTNADEVK